MIRALERDQVSPSPPPSLGSVNTWPARYDWNYSKVTSSKVGLQFRISFKQNHTVDGNQQSGKKTS